MSSLQKFHRRTQSVGSAAAWPATAIGMGDDTHGYWLGDVSTNKLIVSPKSTETQLAWGSYKTRRSVYDTSYGLPNTNTLAGFGSSITTGHPAAYYCKNLTTGGYNTWYLPAKDELASLYSTKARTPFATYNSFVTGSYYWSSTENNSYDAWINRISDGTAAFNGKSNFNYSVRAVRRTTV